MSSSRNSSRSRSKIILFFIYPCCLIELGFTTNKHSILSLFDNITPRYHTWDYIQFDKVVWSALPGQLITVLSMIVVVALSSSLDIAAIDLEIPKPLEYNYELRMIGLSNILSGMTGGYTGSYIFSQSIFSLRAGIRSRLMGYTIALCEGITIILPISILSYVPNFVFGSLLIMICVDLMVEWLWDVRKKVSKSDYILALATFILIQFLSVVFGILGGIILHLILLKLGFNVNSSSRDEEQSQTQGEETTLPITESTQVTQV